MKGVFHAFLSISHSAFFLLDSSCSLLNNVKVFRPRFSFMSYTHRPCIQARHRPQVLIWQFLVRLSLRIFGFHFCATGPVYDKYSQWELVWGASFAFLASQHHSMLQRRRVDLHAFISLTSSFPYAKATDYSCVWKYLFAKAKRKTQAP